MDLTNPKYMYADILIAMACADDVVDDREREVLDGMFEQMGLDREETEKMWLTPRTLDVVESILADVEDPVFKRCLLKDCYLLAYADESVTTAESKFIKHVCSVMNVDEATLDSIRQWVETAIEQKRQAEDLFGGEQ